MKRLKKELGMQIVEPDPDNAIGINVLDEKQLKKTELKSIQKNFDNMTKTVMKFDKVVSKDIKISKEIQKQQIAVEEV